jgi:hypothetical protein
MHPGRKDGGKRCSGVGIVPRTSSCGIWSRWGGPHRDLIPIGPAAAYREVMSLQNAIVAVFREFSPLIGRFPVALRDQFPYCSAALIRAAYRGRSPSCAAREVEQEFLPTRSRSSCEYLPLFAISQFFHGSGPPCNPGRFTAWCERYVDCRCQLREYCRECGACQQPADQFCRSHLSGS